MFGKNKGKYLVGKVKDYEKRKVWFFGNFAESDLLKSDLVEIAQQDISNKTPDLSDTHIHKKSVEINIVLSGRVDLKINNKKVTVDAGEFYVVWPYSEVSELGATENTKLIVVRAPSISSDKYQTSK